MSTTAQTTAADLALALRATLAPLRGSSGASRRKGLIWFELTAAGSYRLTSTWQRQWARAHAPNVEMQRRFQKRANLIHTPIRP